MIEKLKLQNFQCHKYTTVHFDPHVTTITGRNDVGKTSIMRALRWVFLNLPSGRSFIRHGSSFSKVTVWVDGHKIERKRGKHNLYLVDGSKYAAFRSSPPERVNSILNVDPNSIVNQHSLPFWFSETPGAVGKALNKIVNLELIDACLTRSAQLIRQAKAETDVGRERLREARIELEELNYVPAMQESFAKLEELEDRLGQTRERKELLSSLLGDLEGRRAKLRGSAQAIQEGRELLKKAEELEEVRRRRDRLGAIIEGAEEAGSEAAGLKSQVAELQRKLAKAMGRRCPACGREFTVKGKHGLRPGCMTI